MNYIELDLIKHLSMFYGENGFFFDGYDEKWVYTGGNLFNNILYTKYKDNDVEEKSSKITERFVKWDVPVSWFVYSFSSPKKLSYFILKNGFEYDESLICMENNSSSFLSTKKYNNKISIMTVTNELNLNLWIKTLIRGYEVAINKELFEMLFLSLNTSYMRYYIAHIRGVPVATCATTLNKLNRVGIYWLSVIPELRCNGIGTSLLKKILYENINYGRKIFFLQAVNRYSAFYRKIGFFDKGIIEIFKLKKNII